MVYGLQAALPTAEFNRLERKLMNDWTAGYVADIAYTYGYYPELNPLRVKLAFLNAGLVCPAFGVACELGFGQGMSANIHAAATLMEWHGTDFNPSQAGFAKELAAASGADARLFDEAFADFVRRNDLPEFDYIGLHGIWSWISDENRAVIVEFIRRKLKVGGVLYISYNTLPGWSAFAPMRHLMTEHAEIIGAEGRGIVNRINDAIEFAEKLLDTNPVFLRANPNVGERIKSLKQQNRHYLAHEYFNRDWHPMHFATMAEWLTAAKLSYACSANYHDHIDSLNLTSEQQAFLADIPDVMFRESVRDFMINQQFRRDYWVKGPRKLSSIERSELFRAQKVLLVAHRPDISLKVSGALGEATMAEEIYNPLLDLLSDHKIHALDRLEPQLRDKGVTLPKLMQALLVLVGSGHLALVQDEKAIAKASQQSEKLNTHLLNKSRGNAEISFLASPVIGGGVAVSRFHQFFLLAQRQGLKQPNEWARFAWQILAQQGQKLLKEGTALESDQENLAELEAMACTFADKRMPVLKALKVF